MICKKCTRNIPDDAIYCCYCGKIQLQLPRKNHRNPRGDGYIYRRGSKWTVRITVSQKLGKDKKIHRKYLQKGGFESERSARDWAIQYRLNRTEKAPAPPLSHYWDIYQSELEKLSESRKTAANIAWARCADIAERKIDTLTVYDLKSTVETQTTSFYPARDMKNLLSHLFRLAGADGYVQKDLPSYIVLPELKEKEQQPFNSEEISKMWQAWETGDYIAAWVLIMIYTGMMPGETMKLRIENIDLKKQQISGAGLKTEVRKESVILLPSIILPVFEKLIDNRESGKLIAKNKDNLYRDYHDFCKRIGIRDLPPYSCRHTTGTALAIGQNIAPETIRKVMRWSKGSAMISRYAHPDMTDALKAVETLKKPD